MGIDAEILVRVPRAVTESEIKLVGNKLCAMFGPEQFFFRGDGRHVLFQVESWQQDGPELLPEEGEAFLRVSLWGRYYGIGYERGDFPFYYMLAEALERLIPGCTVWYGGDSSGVLAEPFDRRVRDEILNHFMRVQHAPYEGHFDHDRRDGNVLNPVCSLCEVEMTRFGFGADYAAFRCACGEQLIISGGTESRTTREERKDREHVIQNLALHKLFEERADLAAEWNAVVRGLLT